MMSFMKDPRPHSTSGGRAWAGEAVTTFAHGKQARFNELCAQVANDLYDDLPPGRDLRYQPKLERYTKNKGTHMIGFFRCKCTGWPSGKVFTDIFFREEWPKCQFDVVVWNQRCRRCQAIVLVNIDEETFRERVTSKLQLWLNLRDPIRAPESIKKTPPHRADLCCACRAGKCIQAMHE